jgi:hypothetical protein
MSQSLEGDKNGAFASQPHAGHIPGQRPFISVAIPTFGRPDTVRRANDSVLRQDFCDRELVGQ